VKVAHHFSSLIKAASDSGGMDVYMDNIKKVIVLAGSKWQIPIIKKLISKGIIVLNINPYEDSPAFRYANEYRLIDILDKEACLSCARDEQVDAVMSEMCDIATPIVAYISEQLGLYSIGLEAAELYTNKFYMREFCKANGLKSPEYRKCYTPNEAVEFFRTLGRKMIMKPLDSNSSHGVYTIVNEAEIEEYFCESLSFSRIDKAVLCERYIEGVEFTIDGIKTAKGHTSLAISEKRHYKHNPNVACTLFFSHKNSNYDYKRLKEVNDRFVNLSGLPFGLTHAEYKYENGEYYLIEIGARGGGNLIASDIVPIMSGVDNYEYLINKTLGLEVNENITPSEDLKERCAVLNFFDTPNKGGRVVSIVGEETIRTNTNVLAYGLNCKVGDIIEPAKDDSARVGFYIAYGDTRDELEKIMDEINETLSIIVA
jgi:biotin carboxylase